VRSLSPRRWASPLATPRAAGPRVARDPRRGQGRALACEPQPARGRRTMSEPRIRMEMKAEVFDLSTDFALDRTQLGVGEDLRLRVDRAGKEYINGRVMPDDSTLEGVHVCGSEVGQEDADGALRMPRDHLGEEVLAFGEGQGGGIDPVLLEPSLRLAEKGTHVSLRLRIAAGSRETIKVGGEDRMELATRARSEQDARMRASLTRPLPNRGFERLPMFVRPNHLSRCLAYQSYRKVLSAPSARSRAS